MITLYGISNCDTVRKSQKWLIAHNIEFTFHDFKKQGLSPALLTSFSQKRDWAELFNKRSTTFRQLPDEVKNNLTDQAMFDAILASPTLLKRPLLLLGDTLHLGFKENQYQDLF
jgi:arsenate reductase